MKTPKTALFACWVALTLGMPALAKAPSYNLLDVASASGQFKLFLKLVKDAGLLKTLEAKGPYTVFAPTDQAVSKLSKETWKSLLNDKPKLKKLVLNHIFKGRLTSAGLVALDGKTIVTAEGTRIRISAKGNKTSIGIARVAQLNLTASNGVIHAIDTVLFPSVRGKPVSTGAGGMGGG